MAWIENNANVNRFFSTFNIFRRSLRASGPSDAVATSVKEESKVVQGLKKSLEEHLALVDHIFLQLKGARDAMVEYLKSFESPIHLAPLSYR